MVIKLLHNNLLEWNKKGHK